ncbi:hypothetical protein R6Q59_010378 [Mikania micrantha]
MVAEPNATIDAIQECYLKQVSFSPFYPGNLTKESVGTHSNSTTISPVEPQLPISRDDLQKPIKFPPLSRQDRIQRYLNKKKKRKYEAKVIYSSRRTFAQTRPRIRGRFAKCSQTDA